MLSPVTVQLILDVRALVKSSPKQDQRVQEDPEAWIVSLLEIIKKDLPRGWNTLRSPVGMASYEVYMDKAREKLQQAAQQASS